MYTHIFYMHMWPHIYFLKSVVLWCCGGCGAVVAVVVVAIAVAATTVVVAVL